MTKVQALFRAAQPLDEARLARLAGLHSVYGIARVRAEAGKQDLAVEYDATRLELAEVEALLEAAGLAVAPQN